MGMIEVFDPTAQPRVAEKSMAARQAKPRFAKIGFLSNKKANARALLEEVAVLLQGRFGAFEEVWAEKGAAVPVPDEDRERLAACDAMVTAMADCGSCTSWSLVDTMTLESRGVPSVLLCTDEFAPLARGESVARGMPGLPLMTVPHPVADNTREQIRAKAALIADEVVRVLTTSAEQVAADYRERFQRLEEKRLPGGAACIDDTCVLPGAPA